MTESATFSSLHDEVQGFGSKSFTGFAKKVYKEEEYRKLTGSEVRRDVVPMKIMR